MRRDEAGFTLVEILVAVVVLGVGVIALLGSSSMVTRMIGEGKHVTLAVNYGERRLETLRRAASSSACAAGIANGNRAWAGDGVSEAWTVSGAGKTRQVVERVTFATHGQVKTVTLRTSIPCY
jgi:prepilin-type N-terminal cleavage/methylation domain-containing protein